MSDNAAQWRRPEPRYVLTAAAAPAFRLGMVVVILTLAYLGVTVLNLVPRARLDDAIPFGIGVAGVIAIAFVVLLVVLGYAVVSAAVRVRSLRYRITDEEVALRAGVLHQSSVTLPYSRIHSVTTSRGVVDRMFGLTSLTCQTASDQGNITLPGLAAADAESIRQLILTRTGSASHA